MKITGRGSSWAHKKVALIKQQMKAEGHEVLKGQVPKSWFDKLYGLEDEK